MAPIDDAVLTKRDEAARQKGSAGFTNAGAITTVPYHATALHHGDQLRRFQCILSNAIRLAAPISPYRSDLARHQASDNYKRTAR